MSDVRLPIDQRQFANIIDLVSAQPWLLGKKESLFTLLLECPTRDHEDLVIDLLKRTFYIDIGSYISSVNELGRQIEVDWGLTSDNVYFVSSNNKETTDSSQEVLNQLKSYCWTTAGWSRKQFFTRYRDVAPQLKSGDVVIIVDDFIGSGDTMIKTIDWFKHKSGFNLGDVDIRVVSVSGCEEGIQKIESAGTKIYVSNWVPKAISSHFKGADLAKAINLMKNLEDILQSASPKNSLEKYRFGWGKQEAVFYRQGGNTPNNVFPIMWWKNTTARDRRTVMNRTL